VQTTMSPPWRVSATRAAAASHEEPSIRLTLLNGFELRRDGIEVHLAQGPQHLLAYLAFREKATPRAQLAGVLWDQVTDDRAAGNLRSAVWRLRQLRVELLTPERDCLSLARCIDVDVRETDQIARLVMDPTTDVCDLRLEELPLTGELLPGWYQDWVILERERQRQICLHTLEILCERWALIGEFAKAVMAGLAAVAGDPLRESAHRVLIKAYLAEGNRSEALRQYGLCRQILQKELHIEPSRQLTELIGGLTT
jgi:DNA-binding SARP family transcriptional activator